MFTPQFPRIARAFEKLDDNTLIDGEIVVVDVDGRISSIYYNITAQRHALFSSTRLIFSSIADEVFFECHCKAAGNCSLRLFMGLPILSGCRKRLRRPQQI